MTQYDVEKLGDLRRLLAATGFQFKKQLGQNFLTDAHVLAAIVEAAEIGPDDGAFEIGPGAGVVTRRLAQAAKRVVAVEKDRSLQPVLAASLAGYSNVEVLYGDVLEQHLPAIWERFADCGKVAVVANLPYYVTTPILFHLLESKVRIDNAVVMVQREVADRMAAAPGGKDYGALSVAIQFYAQVDRVARVSPGCFTPPPNVESAVVRLRPYAKPPVHVADEDLFFRVVRASFAMRRKTLLNALVGPFGLCKEECRDLLAAAGIDAQRRGETLSIEEFAGIANLLAAHGK